MSDNGIDIGYVPPRRQEFAKPEPRPETVGNPKHAGLSRAELEAAVDYWQPMGMALRAEVNRLREDRAKYRRLGFWGRVRWLIWGKA